MALADVGGWQTWLASSGPEAVALAKTNAPDVILLDMMMPDMDGHAVFDAVICLGNSFTHLFREQDRRKTLAEFYATLRHDGFLMLDQRNYDVMLDKGFKSKGKRYYYCGNDVEVAPEHVDEGLARFQYKFPDESTYHLNMFPLRKDYTRRLLTEVGFQEINTYGDFQETYHDEEPDFFVHVAEKQYKQSDDDEPPQAEKE